MLWEDGVDGEVFVVVVLLYVKGYFYGEYVFDWVWVNVYV